MSGKQCAGLRRLEGVPIEQTGPVMAFAAGHLDGDISLAALAAKAGLSPFHLHRVFAATAGETPKQFTLRLRLERAAALLLTRDDSVLDIAMACGFGSHEAFCRAFRKRFGMPPRAYRKRGFPWGADRAQAEAHAAVVKRAGPCVGLFRLAEGRESGERDMAYTIVKKEIAAQPVLVVRRRARPDRIAAALGEALGQVFLFAQKNGAAIVGQPFTRYIEWGPGLLTIEAGLPVAAVCKGEGEVVAGELPGGTAAATVHTGPYDKLNGAHAALQVWIEEQGLKAVGAPWEVYVTDPADYPDPADWKTELLWPIG